MTPEEFERKLEKRARQVPGQIDVHGSFDGWHTHVDWNREVKRSKVRRQAELRVLFRLHDRLAERLAARREPWQLSIVVHPSDPGQDLVQIQTPSKDRPGAFPFVLPDADWDFEVPDWLASHAPRPRFDVGLDRRKRTTCIIVQSVSRGTVRIRPR